MESPFKSWCYNCDAYHNPVIQYRLAPDHKVPKKLTIEYKATCPLCQRKMIPDVRIRTIIKMAHDQFNKDLAESETVKAT